MDNFCICIATKGRPYVGLTFDIVKGIDVPIVLYVDEAEEEVYGEHFPDYEVVPHTSKNIVAIRGIIQEDQYRRGNNYLQLDDDIESFWYFKPTDLKEPLVRAMGAVIRDAKRLFAEGKDFLSGLSIFDMDFYTPMVLGLPTTVKSRDWLPMMFAVTGLTPRMYDIGFRLSDTKLRSEDIYMSAEAYIAQERGLIQIGMLDALFELSQEPLGHFQQDLYWDSVFQGYNDYGYLFDFIIDKAITIPHTHFNKEALKLYVASGHKIRVPYYDEIYRAVYQSGILKETSYYHWQHDGCTHSPREIARVDKHKEFIAANPEVLATHDFLLQAQMAGRHLRDMPEPITRENFHEGIEVLEDGTEVPAVWRDFIPKKPYVPKTTYELKFRRSFRICETV